MASSIADFALLRKVAADSAGELFLAARVLEASADERVQLLRLPGAGRDAALKTRFVQAAQIGAQVGSARVPAVIEVGVFKDDLYAAAWPVDGVPLRELLEEDRRAGRKPFLPFCLAIATELARIVEAIHERGDVWAQTGGAALTGALPAGLVPSSIVIAHDGAVRVRLLSSWMDRSAKSAFIAPEVKTGGRARAPSDVWAVGAAFRALLSGDPDGGKTLRPGVGRGTVALLQGALEPDADLRIDAIGLRERLEELLYEARPRSTHELIADVLRERYDDLIKEVTYATMERGVAARIRKDRARLVAGIERLFPAPGDEGDTIPPGALDEPSSRTDVSARPASLSSLANDVFTGEGLPFFSAEELVQPTGEATQRFEALADFEQPASVTDPDELRRPIAAKNVRRVGPATPSRDFSKPEGSRGAPRGQFTRVDRMTVLLPRAPKLASGRADDHPDEATRTVPGPEVSGTESAQPRSSEIESMEPGSLAVDAPTGSVVFVNGTELGRGELVVRGLDRFARYVLRVHLAGFRPWSVVVTLNGKPSAKVVPTLIPR